MLLFVEQGEDEYQTKACHKQGELKSLPGAVASVKREVLLILKGSDSVAASQQLCGLGCTQLPCYVLHICRMWVRTVSISHD